MHSIKGDVIGQGLNEMSSNFVDNITLVKTNAEIRNHEVEIIGEQLRSAMDGMKSL